MARKLIGPLREAPATVPALAAMGLFVAWATDQAGYPVTDWGPGGLLLLALLGIAFAAVGLRARELPTAVKVALAGLAAYTALSYLSILWARVPGDAWEGANRTLLYLTVFALFAAWRQRGATAALLLGAWTLAMVGLAVYVALHLKSASTAELQRLLPSGRLVFLTGYANANAAQWLMAFWPALLLARSRHLPWALRGILAGGAVLLAEVALLSQSRGSLHATALMLVLVFAVLPGRLRTFAVMLPVGLATLAAAPSVLHVGDDRRPNGEVIASTLHHALAASLAAAVVVAVLVAAAAAVENRLRLAPGSLARLRRATAAVAITLLVAVLAGGLLAAGDPVARVEHAWRSFKGGYGANANTGSRLASGLGSNRYDFYRVAVDEFAARPLLGIGADNFQLQYLAHGRSDETPRYPHSVELRTLTETGVIGALLALLGLAGALLAALRACRAAAHRSHDPLAPDVSCAALAGFAYWAVHGSIDWFWEFAGLGAPAFAMLGLACALTPSRARGELASGPSGTPAGAGRPFTVSPGPRIGGRRASLLRPALPIAAAVLLALAATASLAVPWLSQRQIGRAARIWTTAPASAYASLDEAARLNPLSDEAYVVAGSIALRYGELARADHEFALALRRSPGDAYATLERGAIASSSGRRAQALRLLEAAVWLSPRDPLARQALVVVRRGGRVSVEELNRSILVKARQLT
ncbi:MAG TPA: O-antigen ligase family protein [Solirubrobacteraceae bacterium]|nr:O-antigen ligase family protein [Solirubrobacteraceae bacterium]